MCVPALSMTYADQRARCVDGDGTLLNIYAPKCPSPLSFHDTASVRYGQWNTTNAALLPALKARVAEFTP